MKKTIKLIHTMSNKLTGEKIGQPFLKIFPHFSLYLFLIFFTIFFLIFIKTKSIQSFSDLEQSNPIKNNFAKFVLCAKLSDVIPSIKKYRKKHITSKAYNRENIFKKNLLSKEFKNPNIFDLNDNNDHYYFHNNQEYFCYQYATGYFNDSVFISSAHVFDLLQNKSEIKTAELVFLQTIFKASHVQGFTTKAKALYLLYKRPGKTIQIKPFFYKDIKRLGQKDIAFLNHKQNTKNNIPLFKSFPKEYKNSRIIELYSYAIKLNSYSNFSKALEAFLKNTSSFVQMNEIQAQYCDKKIQLLECHTEVGKLSYITSSNEQANSSIVSGNSGTLLFNKQGHNFILIGVLSKKNGEAETITYQDINNLIIKKYFKSYNAKIKIASKTNTDITHIPTPRGLLFLLKWGMLNPTSNNYATNNVLQTKQSLNNVSLEIHKLIEYTIEENLLATKNKYQKWLYSFYSYVGISYSNIFFEKDNDIYYKDSIRFFKPSIGIIYSVNIFNMFKFSKSTDNSFFRNHPVTLSLATSIGYTFGNVYYKGERKDVQKYNVPAGNISFSIGIKMIKSLRLKVYTEYEIHPDVNFCKPGLGISYEF